MKKKKKNHINSEENSLPKVENDLSRIYIYVRDWKLIAPVPYVFKMDTKKIQEFKG
jgi:hypothetical protein